MKTRKRKRRERRYRGQWEYRFGINGGLIAYLGGSRHFNRETERLFGDIWPGMAWPAFAPIIHKGGKP